MKLLARMSWVAFSLAFAQVLVGLTMALLGNPEGAVGGVLFASMYALPLLAIGFALRSGRRAWHLAAGWTSLCLGVFYTLVVIGNWSGYSTQLAVFAVAVTVPTVALCAVVSWATIVRQPARAATQGMRPT